ncbi:hypothetical protein Ciccas_011080 [Cichlidogyrus casuarinus]|uniref:Uncharacterized protein n=1 Tax=Cichlidogyrus casuarinus TaxID=1844966 RepID=A0ABD2PS94_9PLAT
MTFLFEEYNELSCEILRNNHDNFPYAFVCSVLSMCSDASICDPEITKQFFEDCQLQESLIACVTRTEFITSEPIVSTFYPFLKGFEFYTEFPPSDGRLPYSVNQVAKSIFQAFLKCCKSRNCLDDLIKVVRFVELTNQFYPSTELTNLIGNYIDDVIAQLANPNRTSIRSIGYKFVDFWKIINTYFLSN